MIETSRKTIDKVNTYQPGYLTSTLFFACNLLIIMMLLALVQGCSLHQRPLCGFWLDILPQIRTCSLRSSVNYAFGREHESGAKSLSQSSAN